MRKKTDGKSTLAESEPEKTDKRIRSLIAEAHTDGAAADELFKVLKEEDALTYFVTASDVAKQAELSLIRQLAPDDILMAKMNEKRLQIMRRDLAGDNPTALETLLAQRIALCWFHVHLCETVVVQNSGKASIKQLEFQEKRFDRAHKRYLGAIKALAQVRRLQLPTIQMNIGEKQVNVGTLNGAANGKLLDQG